MLLESIDQGLFVCEIILDERGKPVDYRFLETNPSFEELTGLRDATGKTARELVPDLEPHWFELYGSVALTGRPIRFSEGSEVMGSWFDVYAFRVGGDNSLQVAALFTNITEHKRAEDERERLLRALELERGRLATVFREAPAAIATLRGPSHVFEMANPMYYQLAGKRELIGRTAREVFPEVVDQGFIDLLDGVYNSGESFVGRGIRIVLSNDSDGQQTEHYLDFVYQPLKDPDGAISGIFVHVVDVTEHKRTADALAKAHDEMERRVDERTAELKTVNEELESFNYSVSHDLRSPLRGIDGFSQMLQEDFGYALDDAGRDYLQRIRAATERMGELIDDLLDLSRLTRTEVERQELDLSATADQIAAELQEREPVRKITIRVEKGMTAVGDSSLLRIALTNLLQNSVKFTHGREQALIEVGVSDEHEDTVYFVRDNGAGFSMNYAERLFVPFQRLHGVDEYVGTGIGLATVQRVIHKHGGSIWAVSKPNEGATFYFTLPPEARTDHRARGSE